MSTTDSVSAPPPEPTPQMRMLHLLSGFQVSQALYVVAKLDIATLLADGPRTIEELAAASGAQPDALGRIVRALSTLGVFRVNGDDVALTDLGATLSHGRPDSLRHAALYFMETHYAPFGDLLHTARTGESAATHHYGRSFFEWIAADPDRAAIQNLCFADITSSLRSGMFDGYRLPEGAVVADIGGADGALLARLIRDEPERTGLVFDSPRAVAAVRETADRQGLGDRLRGVGGDFFTSAPAADVYVLSYVLHDWGDEESHRILGTIARAAAPGARLVLVETVVPPGDAPHLAKVVDLTMLAMTSGRERTAEEYRTLLEAAGFTLDRVVPTSTPFSFIEATLR